MVRAAVPEAHAQPSHAPSRAQAGSSAPRRVLLIANPISGGGRGRAGAPALAAALRARGVEAEVHRTNAAGDAERRAATAAGEAWDALVALGGDGTVNEVLNGMADLDVPLGVLPVGTANVLALELGLPRDVDAAAAVIAQGRAHPLAVGISGGRRFLLFVGVGVDGAIVKRMSEVRTGTLSKLKWLGPLLHVVRRWPQPRLRVSCDGGAPLDDVHTVLVTRVRNYGGILYLPDAHRDSGELHVLAFHMRSRLRWLYHGLRATLGLLRAGRHLTILRAREVRIEGAAPCQLDGDYAGESPLQISLEAAAVRVLAPEAAR